MHGLSAGGIAQSQRTGSLQIAPELSASAFLMRSKTSLSHGSTLPSPESSSEGNSESEERVAVQAREGETAATRRRSERWHEGHVEEQDQELFAGKAFWQARAHRRCRD